MNRAKNWPVNSGSTRIGSKSGIIKIALTLSILLARYSLIGQDLVYDQGGVIRGDSSQKVVYLIFTGGDYNDGRYYVRDVLRGMNVKASFFFTGDFYRASPNRQVISDLISDGHYLGPHSDKHLLYAPWENRDSLLVSKKVFVDDLNNNYLAMSEFGLSREESNLFMPPYEWYNDSISAWSKEMGLILVNYTPGTGSNADYTTPDMGSKYRSTDWIYAHIMDYEASKPAGLNGFYLLLHIGTHPDRTDKFYYHLGDLISELRSRGYRFDLIEF